MVKNGLVYFSAPFKIYSSSWVPERRDIAVRDLNLQSILILQLLARHPAQQYIGSIIRSKQISA